ncbi:hypothetical protein [Bacillus mojavensis]
MKTDDTYQEELKTAARVFRLRGKLNCLKYNYEEYEELKKKTIKVIQRKNYSIRIIGQRFEDDSLNQFYNEVARVLFERALKKKNKN